MTQRTAFITGEASGIGKAIVQRLAIQHQVNLMW